MFNKLSFDELSKFYGALSDLEKHYGQQKVREAAQEMSDKLDAKVTSVKIDASKVIRKSIEQMELLPFEPTPAEVKEKFTRVKGITRSQHGLNEKKIREWADRCFRELSPEETIVWLYHVKKKTQKQIGNLIGVNQRAICEFLKHIPEEKKQRIIQQMGTSA